MNTETIVETIRKQFRYLHLDTAMLQAIDKNTCRLYIPILDVHNDFIEIEVTRLDNNFYRISDVENYFSEILLTSIIDSDFEDKKKELQKYSNYLDVQLEEFEIVRYVKTKVLESEILEFCGIYSTLTKNIQKRLEI